MMSLMNLWGWTILNMTAMPNYGSLGSNKPQAPNTQSPPPPDTNPTPMPDVMDLPETLDGLWEYAEKFGRVKLEKEIRGGQYTGTVVFNTKAGSYISAKGEGTTPHLALRAVIKEAANLKAGVIFADA